MFLIPNSNIYCQDTRITSYDIEKKYGVPNSELTLKKSTLWIYKKDQYYLVFVFDLYINNIVLTKKTKISHKEMSQFLHQMIDKTKI